MILFNSDRIISDSEFSKNARGNCAIRYLSVFLNRDRDMENTLKYNATPKAVDIKLLLVMTLYVNIFCAVPPRVIFN
jgi:hypothetical protein